MSDDTTTLTRRRLFSSFIALGVGGVASGSGTAALFADSTTTNNSLRSGTLSISFGPEGRTLGLTSELNPGERTWGSVTLVNQGSVSGELEIQVAYQESDNSNDKSGQEVASNLTVTTLEYGTNNLLQSIDALQDPSLHELSTVDITGLSDPGEATAFEIELELADVRQGNGQFGGEAIEVWVTFTLTQPDAG